MTRSEHDGRWHLSGLQSALMKIGLRHHVGDGTGVGARRPRDRVRRRRRGRTGGRWGYEIEISKLMNGIHGLWIYFWGRVG